MDGTNPPTSALTESTPGGCNPLRGYNNSGDRKHCRSMPSVLVFVIGVDRWMSPNYHPSNCLPGRDRQGAILEEWSERSESFMRSGWRLKGLERTDVSGLQTDLKRLRRSSAVGEARGAVGDVSTSTSTPPAPATQIGPALDNPWSTVKEARALSPSPALWSPGRRDSPLGRGAHPFSLAGIDVTREAAPRDASQDRGVRLPVGSRRSSPLAGRGASYSAQNHNCNPQMSGRWAKCSVRLTTTRRR